MRAWRLAACLAVLGALAACSSTRTYREGPEKNVQVRADLSKVHASIDVYRVDEQCQMEYEGTVAIDTPTVQTGIPAGRPSVLVFTFTSSSFFGPRGTITRQGTLQPRAGYRYQIDLRYKDDIYDIALSEISARDGTARRLDLSTQGTCRRG